MSDDDPELLAAARAGDLARVRAAIASGADVDEGAGLATQYPITLAARGGHAEIIDALLAAGARCDVQDYGGDTPLHLAARLRDPIGHRIVERLLRAGARPDARAHGGWQPLHLVKLPEVARALLAAGADVNARADDRDEPAGQTPLHKAAERGLEEVVAVLLAAGANVNARDDRDATALYLAASHPAVVRRLLVAGADPDVLHYRGFTALHQAALSGQPESIGALLAARARVDLPTRTEIRIQNGVLAPRGSTAADLARLAGHPELADRIATAARRR